ncbi:MAG: cytochrome c oxidase assembly factor Coa1 family protein [Rhizomicrobium sp.]
MTDTAPATPGPLPPPPPRRHGCLYGCLIAGAIVALLIIGGGAYLFWYLGHGVKDSATVKAAIAQVDADQVARSVLGDGIEVTGASSFNATSDLASGSRESYVVHVKGTKGEGDLAIEAETPRGGALHFDKLSLTAGGQTYDLLHLPGNPPGAI